MAARLADVRGILRKAPLGAVCAIAALALLWCRADAALAQAVGEPWGGPSAEAMPPAPQYGGAPAPGQQGGSGMSDQEAQMRMMLMQRSMGFGGIFGPALNQWANTPRQSDPCDAYSDYAACQAHKNGDDWAAERLQNNQSSGAERDWYNR